jgi:hypothetical protein
MRLLLRPAGHKFLKGISLLRSLGYGDSENSRLSRASNKSSPEVGSCNLIISEAIVVFPALLEPTSAVKQLPGEFGKSQTCQTGTH